MDQPSDFKLEDPTHFGLDAMALVGPAHDGSADAFHFIVCSPSWFAVHFPHGAFPAQTSDDLVHNVVIGAGIVFMDSWSEERLRQLVQAICDQYTGPDWGSVASRIGRRLPWEYARDYDEWLDHRGGDPFPPPRGRS